MKRASLFIITAAAIFVTSALRAQLSAINYQGRLNDAGLPANGWFDVRFSLYDALSSVIQVGPVLTNRAVAVNDGFFSATLDFGPNVFTGAARWLEIAVRTNGNGSFTLLNPRQPMNPVPYALFASNAAIVNAVAPGSVTAASIAPGQVVKTINGLADGVTLASGNNVTLTTNSGKLTFTTPTDWHVDGNIKTVAGRDFLGTTDDQPLELKVNGRRALRLEPESTHGAPNVIGGSEVNWVGPSVLGAFIGGGGAVNHLNRSYTNYVGGDFSAIGGGRANSAVAERSVIAGGDGNKIGPNAGASVIGGGSSNEIQTNSTTSVIAGGTDNTIFDNSQNSTIAGGRENVIRNASDSAAIGGGYRNTIENNSHHSLVAGGSLNQIQGYAEWAIIGGGSRNTISSNANYATLAGGLENELQRGAQYGAIGGGYRNIIRDASWAAIGGGNGNYIGTNADGAVIPGGYQNQALGNTSFAAGFRASANHDGTFVWSDHSYVGNFKSSGSNQFLIRADGGVGIGKNNPASQLDVKGTVTATAFVGNGAGLTDVKVSASGLTAGTITNSLTFNPASGAPFVVSTTNKVANLNADWLDGLDSAAFWKIGGNSGTVGETHFLGTTDAQPLDFRAAGMRALRLAPGGKAPNLIGGYRINAIAAGVSGSTIAGGGSLGDPNAVDADFGFIGSGNGNHIVAGATHAVISGGTGNAATGLSSVVAGGEGNQAVGPQSVVSGGYANWAQGGNSTVGGGYHNLATNLYATVGGGGDNLAAAQYSVVSGGRINKAYGENSTVAGGSENVATNDLATVGGGKLNLAESRAVVAGGVENTASAKYATVGGGNQNQARGYGSTVPGGAQNDAFGGYSFAAGYRARAWADGAFVWADKTAADFTSMDPNSFYVRANGGVKFYTGSEQFWTEGELSCATLTIRGGADLAEPFAFTETGVPAGAVVVIDDQNPGRLKLSTCAYDYKVAGIVSGAGGVKPGISMIQTEALEGGRNVALSGRVYALVDATQEPVKPGDLLTTSNTPGHAMKALDRQRRPGAILGKAMTPLKEGRGLVLVLVSLQ